MIMRKKNLEEIYHRTDEGRRHPSEDRRSEDHHRDAQEGLPKEDKHLDEAHHRDADMDHLHLGLLPVLQRKLLT
jgi:hypothetical protein